MGFAERIFQLKCGMAESIANGSTNPSQRRSYTSNAGWQAVVRSSAAKTRRKGFFIGDDQYFTVTFIAAEASRRGSFTTASFLAGS